MFKTVPGRDTFTNTLFAIRNNIKSSVINKVEMQHIWQESSSLVTTKINYNLILGVQREYL